MGHLHEAHGEMGVHRPRISRPPPHLAEVRRPQPEGGADRAGQEAGRADREPHAGLRRSVEDGRAIGAIARQHPEEEPEIKIIRAKAVILATGSASRLYPPAGSPGCSSIPPFVRAAPAPPTAPPSGRARPWSTWSSRTGMRAPSSWPAAERPPGSAWWPTRRARRSAPSSASRRRSSGTSRRTSGTRSSRTTWSPGEARPTSTAAAPARRTSNT